MLQAKFGLVPAESPLSLSLTATASTTAGKLLTLVGPAFDVAYLDAQITAHTEMLSLIDQQLLPSAALPALRALLESARTVVTLHLDQAIALRATLGPPHGP